VALLAVVSNRTGTTANVAVVADGTTFPGVSSLNPAPGERTAVAVTSGLSAGRVRVVSSQVVDVELFVVGVYVSSITPTLTPASGVGPSGLVFDPLGRLTTTTAGGVTVEYSYLADGTRVAARTQGGAQVYYLGGIEATRTTGGVWSQVRRTYPYGGVTVASRTTTPTATQVSWLLGDRQGSITTTVTAGTATTRWYLPYGGRRGPSPGSVPTTTGFLGQHEDGSGLTHLEHRDYDPTTGVFITIDPLVASTGDPYSYAAGNPTTLSDPNGLCATNTLWTNVFGNAIVNWAAGCVADAAATVNEYVDKSAESLVRAGELGDAWVNPNAWAGYRPSQNPMTQRFRSMAVLMARITIEGILVQVQAQFEAASSFGLLPGRSAATEGIASATTRSAPEAATSAASGASNAATAPALARQLAFEEASSIFTSSGGLKRSVIDASREIIPGTDLSSGQLIKTLTADGSSIADWGKFSTPTFNSPSGPFQVHFYMNPSTGIVHYLDDFKVVFNGPR
jgi:RHS repeat-associated protein